MTTHADGLFAEYQRTRDPATLAAVFDLTAPQLLLLAIHLTGDDLGAEDLVQSTFLRIIENARSYDRTKPFLPWASSILGNEARAAWRKRERTGRTADLVRTPPSDPSQVAADADTLECLTNSIDNLEESYRAVVHLKVLHGMRPREIAKALSIQPELARTRLSRGLKILREGLPAGVAGSALLMMNGRGLAAMRQEVLGHALRANVAKPAILALSALQWTLLAALVGLGSWAALLLRPDVSPEFFEETSIAQGTSDHTWGARTPPQVRTARARGQLESSNARTAVLANAPNGNSTRRPWTLTGVVRSTSGLPLAGASVRANILHGCEVIQLNPVQTDSSGNYALDVDALRHLGDLGLLQASLLFDASAAGHWPVPSELIETMPASIDQPGRFQHSFTLTPGRTLSATLVSSRGEAPTCLSLARLVTQGEPAVNEWNTFDPGEPIRLAVRGNGPWRLEVWCAAGTCFLALDALPVDGDLGALPLSTHGVVRGRLTVAGSHPVRFANFKLTHVDDPAQPVERPTWHAGSIRLANSARSRTDADGKFEVTGLEPGRYRLQLEYSLLPPFETVLTTDAPAQEVELEGQSLSVRVVDATGRAIPGLALHFEWELAGERHFGHTDINDIGGVFDFLVPFESSWRFRSGTWRIGFPTVEHLARRGQSHAELTIPVALETPESRIALQVQDTRGRTLEHYEVDLHHLRTDHFVDTIDATQLARLPIPIGIYNADLRSSPGPGVAFITRSIQLAVEEPGVTHKTVTVQLGGRVMVKLYGHDGPGAVRLLTLEERVRDEWTSRGGFAQEVDGGWSWRELQDPARPLCSHAVLPEGPHDLRLRAGGDVSDEFRCLIERGRTSELWVRFEDR